MADRTLPLARARLTGAHAQVLALEHELAAARARLALAADELVQLGESRRTVARQLGTSHAQVGVLVDEAQRTRASVPGQLVPVIYPWQVADYRDTFGDPAEVFVASSTLDLLVGSRLHPASFLEETYAAIPHLLLRSRTGGVMGVEDCHCGYGGTGPHNSHGVLRELGVEDADAKLVFDHAYVHLDRVTGRHQLARDPYISLEQMEFHAGAPTGIVTRGWFLESPRGAPQVPAWKRQSAEWVHHVLDAEPRLPWADGERVARCYLTSEAVEEAGLRRHGLRWERFTVIIEQGDAQLWVSAYQPTSFSELLSEEQYELLAIADLYPEKLAARERRSWLQRLLAQYRTRPPYIDISRSGTARLQREPHGPPNRPAITTA
jgi:hypothetical protein